MLNICLDFTDSNLNYKSWKISESFESLQTILRYLPLGFEILHLSSATGS